jgi:hypothetical protein
MDHFVLLRWLLPPNEVVRGSSPPSPFSLTSREVERLIEATESSRNEVRDRCRLRGASSFNI